MSVGSVFIWAHAAAVTITMGDGTKNRARRNRGRSQCRERDTAWEALVVLRANAPSLSWLGLDLAISVASDTPCLGHQSVFGSVSRSAYRSRIGRCRSSDHGAFGHLL